MLILSDTIRKIEILFYKEESRMRGVETRIQEIRHKIFTEVARILVKVWHIIPNGL